MTEREALLRKVQAASFAIDDVKLFLDSHPDNAEALCYFEKYKLLKRQLTKQYEQQFGPLSVDGVDVAAGTWTWTKEPWPWHVEG